MERLEYIDKVKGLAILFVVICHIYVFSYGNTNFDGFRFVMSVELQVFMYVSGFLMYKQRVIGELKDNISRKIFVRKLKCLLFPFFVYGLLFSCFMAFKNGGDKASLYHQIVDNFLLADIKNGYWYLLVLAWFAIVVRLSDFGKKRGFLLDATLVIGIYIVFCSLWKLLGAYSSLMSMYMCVLYFPFFIFGYMTKKYNLQKILLSDKAFTLGMIGFVCTFLCLHSSGIVYTLSNRLLVPLFGIIIIQKIMVEREGRNTVLDKVLSFMGTHTLDIYVFHYFFVTSINLHSIGLWGKATNNDLLLFFLSWIMAMPIASLSVIVGRIIRKSNILRTIIYG